MNLAFYVKLNEYQFHHKLTTNTQHNTTKSKIQTIHSYKHEAYFGIGPKMKYDKNI